jgi:hypothetical protein
VPKPGFYASLFTAAISGTTPVFDLGQPADNITVQINATATAWSILFQGSQDGVNFSNLGSAITQATAMTAGVPGAGMKVVSSNLCRFIKATLSGVSGGTVTASIEALPGV